ncbi:PP2C family protein-serine/threonine phosphatase [Butyrivibrio sp.]|jgi:protein phosphatase|uniref:PP2C family protein-serine/threonine phosphatase n=1 Tax=Butyrivibrio sp. TaxID=28121 RepID=UPI0025C60239|nr:PP2C family serine/threonine-protein phosphatase [Butyrivibrio sp.]MBE5837972.1 serine/threonine-protein phosphatase [Butyrivibrio sp.]
MQVSVGVSIGIGKNQCDDTALVGQEVINNQSYSFETDGYVSVAVADGVGGNKGGKEASLFVTDALSKLQFANETELRNKIVDLNNELIQYASGVSEKEKMATTLTYVGFCGEESYLVHIGNTRLYAARGAYLKQITEDHTTYQWLLSTGQTEAAESCNKNEITACLGGGNADLADKLVVQRIFEENKPKCVLITSDGVHEFVETDNLEDELQKNTDDLSKVASIIRIAEENGSTDDKTVMIIRF